MDSESTSNMIDERMTADEPLITDEPMTVDEPPLITDEPLTADERKVYDRQIRLWGLAGQKKLRSINVLIIGMQGLGAEVAKNFILAGVNSVTLQDSTDVSVLDQCSQFLISPDNTEPNRAKASLAAAQKLNPNVKVTAITTHIADEIDSCVHLYDIIVATECPPALYKRLSIECRKFKTLLFAADVYGLFGYFYQDLTFEHPTYGQVFPLEDETVIPFMRNQPLTFILTSALLKFQNAFNRKLDPDQNEEDIKKLKSIIDDSKNYDGIKSDMFDAYYGELFCEISPTTSILGGIVAQTAITNIIEMDEFSMKYNVFFYDNIEHEGKFYLIPHKST